MKLRCRDHVLALDRTLVMGVLNVTPDSFSDGGLWFEAESAIAHGLEMAGEGASIVDVGGESTRPGATPVSAEEELRRVVPVIEALASTPDIVISIDTRKPEVAAQAVRAGASIINDTSGEGANPQQMNEVARDTGAAIVIMHSRGTPATMRSLTEYTSVVDDVRAWLELRARSAVETGISAESIAIDPGIGFAKSPEQSLQLLDGVDQIVASGYPIVVGTSRKSFIGMVLDLPEDERVEGTAATVAWAVSKGAHVVRVHDVETMTRVIRMTEAIRDSRLQ